MGAFFLIADLIAEQRGPDHGGSLTVGPRLKEPVLVGMLFFIAVIALAGLPPLTGFFGKVLILEAAIETQWTLEMWATVLGTSFLTLLMLSRAGTLMFWKTDDPLESSVESARMRALPAIGLLACLAVMVVYAGPMIEFFDAAGAQLTTPTNYIEAVLGEVSG
jgi:multicomponent K+:H+ antiporter subunit D